VPFATLCLRYRPAGRAWDEAQLDRANEAILDALNRGGRYFLSHTRLDGRFTLRVSIGNPRATWAHVEGCWDELRRCASALSP
jgi:aromatic-L-amino-acid/L-tryptophan decarboxylase